MCVHVWQSVRALSLAIVTRQGSPTEHAPTNMNSPCGWHRNRKEATAEFARRKHTQACTRTNTNKHRGRSEVQAGAAAAAALSIGP